MCIVWDSDLRRHINITTEYIPLDSPRAIDKFPKFPMTFFHFRICATEDSVRGTEGGVFPRSLFYPIASLTQLHPCCHDRHV